MPSIYRDFFNRFLYDMECILGRFEEERKRMEEDGELYFSDFLEGEIRKMDFIRIEEAYKLKIKIELLRRVRYISTETQKMIMVKLIGDCRKIFNENCEKIENVLSTLSQDEKERLEMRTLYELIENINLSFFGYPLNINIHKQITNMIIFTLYQIKTKEDITTIINNMKLYAVSKEFTGKVKVSLITKINNNPSTIKDLILQIENKYSTREAFISKNIKNKKNKNQTTLETEKNIIQNSKNFI